MDVDTVAVDGEWIRHAPHRSSLLGRASERRMVAGSTARSYALCISPTSRPPRSPSGIACWPNADCRRPAPSLTTTTYGSSTFNSPTSAHRSGWPA